MFKISIDDFYKTQKERLNLSKKVHPMLATRGVPGTHDVQMMLNFFKKQKETTLRKLIYQISIKQLTIDFLKRIGIK